MAETRTGKEIEVRAQAKWVHSPARKARLVLDTVRGRTVPEARTVLAFSNRAVARDIDKVLRSAVANAEANFKLYGDDMYISACYADEGPRLKRWKPRARGRADRMIKGTCHITIKLTPLGPRAPERPARAKAAAATAKPAPSTPAKKAPAAAKKAPAAGKKVPAAEKAPTGEVAVATETAKKSAAKPKAPAKKPAAKASAKKSEQGAAKPAARRAPSKKKAEE
jgi:large subunit ribosomal protein L22